MQIEHLNKETTDGTIPLAHSQPSCPNERLGLRYDIPTSNQRPYNSFYFPFLNSLGFIPFIRLKKRAKVVTSAKWSWSEIWVMLSEV